PNETLTAAAEKSAGTEAASARSRLLRDVASDKPSEQVLQTKLGGVEGAQTERLKNGGDHSPPGGKEKDLPEEASGTGAPKSEDLVNRSGEAQEEKPSSDALGLTALSE